MSSTDNFYTREKALSKSTVAKKKKEKKKKKKELTLSCFHLIMIFTINETKHLYYNKLSLHDIYIFELISNGI